MKTCRDKRLSRTFCFQAAFCLSVLVAFYFSAAAHAKSSDPGRSSALHESYLLSMQAHDLEYIIASYGAQILYAEDDKKISEEEKLKILIDALTLAQQTSYEEHLLKQQASIIHEGQEEYLIACEGMNGGGIGGIRGPALPCFGGPGLSPLENISETPLKTGSILPSGVVGTVGSAAIIGAGAVAVDYAADTYHISQIEKLVQKALHVQQDSSLSASAKERKTNSLIDRALDHNSKITTRAKSSNRAIKILDIENLRAGS